jgi:hypothetical protein
MKSVLDGHTRRAHETPNLFARHPAEIVKRQNRPLTLWETFEGILRIFTHTRIGMDNTDFPL